MPAGFQSSNVQLRSEKIKGYDSVFSPIGKTLDRMIEVDNRRKDVEDARNFQIQREDVATENRRQDATVAFGRQNEIVDKQQDFQVENINLQNLNQRAGRSQQFGFDVERDKTKHGFKLEEQTQNNGFKLGQIGATNAGNLAVAKQRGADDIEVQRLKNKGISIKAGAVGKNGTVGKTTAQYKRADLSKLLTSESQGDAIQKKADIEYVLNNTDKGKELQKNFDTNGANLANTFNNLPEPYKDSIAKNTPIDKIIEQNQKDLREAQSKVITSSSSGSLFAGHGVKNTKRKGLVNELQTALDKAIAYKQSLSENNALLSNLNKLVTEAPVINTGKFKTKIDVDIDKNQKRINAYVTAAATYKKQGKKDKALEYSNKAQALGSALNSYIKSNQATALVDAKGEVERLKLKNKDNIARGTTDYNNASKAYYDAIGDTDIDEDKLLKIKKAFRAAGGKV